MSLRAVELFYDGGWQPAPGYEQEGWKIKIGPSDLTGMEPNDLDVTLANDDLKYDPSNPNSPLFGKIGPNTPTRFLMYDPAAITHTDTFSRTASSAWNNLDTGQAWGPAGGSASDYSVSGGLGRMSLGSLNVSRRVTLSGSVASGEIAVRMTIPANPTGDAVETSIMFNYTDASNHMQASVFWPAGGSVIRIEFIRRVSGVATTLATNYLDVTPTGAGLSVDTRLRWFNQHMSFKVWPSANPESDTGWNLAARDATFSSGQRGLRANLGASFSGGTPQVVTWDNFTYSPYSASVIGAGEASSWKPETSSEHVPALRGRSWTALSANDLLRRIGKWGDIAISPLRRQITSYSSKLLGYWPMEEGVNAKTFANLSAPRNVAGFTPEFTELAGDEGPAGGFNAPVFTIGGTVGGRFTYDTSVLGYQLCFCAKLDALPATGTYIAMFQWSDTLQRTWYWRVNSTGFEISVYDMFSTLLGSQSSTFGIGVDITRWTRYRIKLTVSSLTVTFEPAWYAQDALSTYGMTGTFTSADPGYPVGWQMVTNSVTDKASFCHIFGTSDLNLDLINYGSAKGAFDAYNGESTQERYSRLCLENNITRAWFGDNSKTAIMGRQPRAKLYQLLEEVAKTEGGIIYGDPTRLRLLFRQNNHLINQTPIMTLTKGGNLGYPLKKVIDDQSAANDITVKNWDDTEVRVTKTSGPRSIQDPPAGVGAYPGDLDVSLRYPENLEQRGAWELANNTLDRPRYPTVVVDLLAHPSLLPAANAAVPGDIIALVGVEPETVYLMVIQIERAGSDVRDTISFTCLPADIFMAGEYDDGVSKYDSKSTTLSAAISSSTTSVPIISSDPMDKWSTAAGYTIRVGPEVMTVTACTAGSASGTGWAQTMTVTRGTNGVSIAHLAAEEVHVATPAKYVMNMREPV